MQSTARAKAGIETLQPPHRKKDWRSRVILEEGRPPRILHRKDLESLHKMRRIEVAHSLWDDWKTAALLALLGASLIFVIYPIAKIISLTSQDSGEPS